MDRFLNSEQALGPDCGHTARSTGLTLECSGQNEIEGVC